MFSIDQVTYDLNCFWEIYGKMLIRNVDYGQRTNEKALNMMFIAWYPVGDMALYMAISCTAGLTAHNRRFNYIDEGTFFSCR